MEEKKNKPKYLFLENVDRLLKSPASQRGRDFAIMLKSLNQLGYAVEWRVINAAEYGMPQRRRRIFILGYHKSTDLYKQLKASRKIDWLLKDGTIANAFPVQNEPELFCPKFELKGDLIEITNNFNKNGKKSPFENAGLMINNMVSSLKTRPKYNGSQTLLKDVLQNGEVSQDFFIPEENQEKWAYLKGAKSFERISKEGHKYKYSEGGMIYPDALDKPSRTIITGEGGKSPSRFKHVIKTERGLRRLTPLELERLNMFPDNHTKLEGVTTDNKRAFFMGNALVVGVIDKLGQELYNQIYKFEYAYI